MPKRKRKESEDLESRNGASNKNPFLFGSERTSEHQSRQENELLEHILAFDDHSKEKKGISNECAASVDVLITHVQHVHKGCSREGVGLFSSSEIALLLLPWAIKHILSTSTAKSFPKRDTSWKNTLVWKTLNVCLSSLCENDDFTVKQTISQNILSQSTLFKLVPRVALAAVINPLDDEIHPSSKKVGSIAETHSSSETSSESESEHSSIEDGTSKTESSSSSDDSLRVGDTVHLTARTRVRVEIAMAYEVLVEKYYRPTLDVACKNLLLPIVEKMDLEEHDARTRIVAQSRPAEKAEHKVLLATLQLIRSLLQSRKGNPKTTFQLFSSRPVLLAFARAYSYFQSDIDALMLSEIQFFEDDNKGQNVVREILYDGLFHPQHHLEGFRSFLSNVNARAAVMKRNRGDPEAQDVDPKSSFRCYQEELLSSLTASLALPENAVSEEESVHRQICDARDASWLVPVLLRGFFEKVKEWDPKSRESKRKASNVYEPALLQFWMFERLAYPLRQLVVSTTKTDEHSVAAVALRSLRELLSLLLQHDSYLPSQDDTEGTQHAFLADITLELLELHGIDDYRGIQLLSDAILGLRLLIQLDHRLLHERLPVAFSFCLQRGDRRLYPHVLDFLITVVDTYRKLRQQRHLFLSLLGLLERSGDHDEGDDLVKLSVYLKDQSLGISLAEMAQSSPIVQVRGIFETVIETTRKICESRDLGNTKENLTIILQLAGITTKNVRVDASTAADVELICRRVVEEVVVELVERSDGISAPSATQLTKAALNLCGLFVDLHTRCSFWLGNQSRSAIPSRVMRILDLASDRIGKQCRPNSPCEKNEYDQLLDELLFLCCHRIRQLHSLVYEQGWMAAQTEKASKASAIYVSEATKLAAFAARAAQLQRSSSVTVQRSRWTTIAKDFASWAPFASQRHVECFLNWLFSALSIDSELPSLPPDSSAHRQNFQGLDEEVECAKALLCDASFFENDKVMASFELSALSCTSDWISWALSDCSTGDSMMDRKLRNQALPRFGADAWSRWEPEDLVDLTGATISFECVLQDKKRPIISKLKQAAYPLMIVNGLQKQVSSSENALDSIDSAVRLENICRSLAVLDDSIREAALPLVGGLRLVIAKNIKSVIPGASRTLFDSHADVERIFRAIFKSAVALTSVHGILLSTNGSDCLLRGTGELIRKISLRSLSLDKSGELLMHSIGWVTHLVERRLFKNRSNRAVAQLARSLLDALMPSAYTAEVDDEFPAGVRNAMFLIVKAIMSERESSDESSVESAGSMTSSESGRSTGSMTSNESGDSIGSYCCELLLLLGDLLRFSTEWKLLRSTDAESDEAFVLPFTEENVPEKLGIDKRESLRYFIACLAQTSPPTVVSRRIVDQVISAGESDPLLDASFCQLIGRLPRDDLDAVVVKLTSSTDSTVENVSNRLRLVRFFLRYVDKDEHGELLSQFGESMLSLASSQLHSEFGDEHWTETIVVSCSLLEDLIRRRDVVSLRERGLARLLAHMSSVLGCNISLIPSSVFASSAQVFALLFQRYTKQLYACAPSVISLLHSFLFRILHDPLSDEDTSDRGQRFARICELLIAHKDIYKKHLLGLILEFVNGLQGNMSLVLKENLLPAIYCLLDSLSSYEMKQLNTLMSSKDKTVFRSVYQSYQKLHVYRGQ